MLLYRAFVPLRVALHQAGKCSSHRRFASTKPPHLRSRSWRNAATRWGLGAGLVYFYNTSIVFADAPEDHETALPQTEVESETTLTIDQIAAQRRARSHAANRLDRPSAESDASLSSTDSPEALEDEAGQQGAFNEETGEINWDCPCLGGMAHGPCGEQFRNAFSCFVFSKEEPKGVDCIDKFKAMQDCFREHRDIYGAEIDDDEEPTNADDQAAMTETGVSLVSNNVDAKERPVDAEPSIAAGVAPQTGPDPKARDSVSQTHRVKSATAQVKHDHPAHQEDQTLVPKAWHDTRGEKGN